MRIETVCEQQNFVVSLRRAFRHREEKSILLMVLQGLRIAFVVGIVLTLATWAWPGHKTSHPAHSIIQKEQRYPNGITTAEVFDLRSKCARLAYKGVHDLNWGFVGDALRASITPHYNPSTNHCYTEVLATKNFGYFPNVPENFRIVSLYDAQNSHLLVFTDREASKEWAIGDQSVSYVKGEAMIKHLMQEDAQ